MPGLEEEQVEVFLTRVGDNGPELLVRRPDVPLKTATLLASVTGSLNPGEHPCEAAWRLTTAITGCEDACLSFHRIKMRQTSQRRVHIFQTALEKECLTLSAVNTQFAVNWYWQALPNELGEHLGA